MSFARRDYLRAKTEYGHAAVQREHAEGVQSGVVSVATTVTAAAELLALTLLAR